jgi:protein-S-isoprenylcysteine O-methyltransferase Ste14
MNSRSLELRIPPPLVLLLGGAAAYALAKLFPGLAFALPGRLWAALGLGVAGVALALAGVVEFRRRRTTVNPLRPEDSSTVVATGIYRFTRNPMYLGMLLVLVAWTLFLASAAAASALPFFVLWMNRFQIGPEERILAASFGAAYTSYLAKVRRWL